MARRKPRSGWKQSEPPWTLSEHTYDDSFLEDVCDRFRIRAPELREKLKRRAALGAKEYRAQRNDIDDRPQPGNVKAALDRLSRKATDLLQELENLDDITARYYREAEHELQTGAMLGQDHALEEIGAYVRHDESAPRHEDGTTELASHLTTDDIYVALKLLRLHVERAEAMLPVAKSGPKRSLALQFWVRRLSDFWEKDLGRQLTYDSHEGQGISQAYQFLATLLEKLDPDAVPKLNTIVAEERTRRRG